MSITSNASAITFYRGEDPLRANKLNEAFNERVLRLGDTMLGKLVLAMDPTDALDAVTKQYVDRNFLFSLNAAYLPLLGGTMAGFIILHSNPVEPMHAATRKYVDDIAAAVGTGKFLPLTGGTLTGALFLPADPSQALQAATKQYVDNTVAISLVPSSTLPIMDGVAAVGALTTYARGDHVHPTDTSRYAASNPAGYITASQAIAGLPIASTTVFGVVKVDGTTITASGGVISSTGGAGVYLPLTGGTLTGTLTIPQGTQTTPQLLFAGAPTNTGIFYLAGIAFTVAGGAKFQIASTANVSYVLLRTADGSVSAPGYSFVQETGSGLFRKTTGVVSMAMLGVEAMNWTATGNTTNALGPLMLAADPTVALQAVTKQYVDARVGGLVDAPSDGKAYSRRNAVWTSNPFYDAKGNVGISVLPPTGQAVSDPVNGGWSFMWGVTANNWATNGYYDGAAWRYLAAGTFWQQQMNGTQVFWQYAPTGVKDAVATPVTKMTLDGPTGDLWTAGRLNVTGDAVINNSVLRINGGWAQVQLYTANAPIDNRQTSIYTDNASGAFAMQFVNDADNAASPFFRVYRSGYTITSMELNAPGGIWLNGNVQANGSYLSATGIINISTGIGGGFQLFTHTDYNRYIRFRNDGWDLLWNNTNGFLQFWGGPNGLLWQCSSAGDTWQAANTSVAAGIVYRNYNTGSTVGWNWNGSYIYLYVDNTFIGGMASHDWVNAAFKPIGAYTPNQNVDSGQSPYFWRAYADNIMVYTGPIYWHNDYSCYMGRNSADGNYNFVHGGTLIGSICADGWYRSAQGVMGGPLFSWGNVYWGNNWTQLLGNGGLGQVLQWASGYYLEYQNSTGMMQYVIANVARFINRNDGPAYNQQSWIGGIGPHVDISDERGKIDIQSDDTGLAAILRLQPIRFRRPQNPKVKLLHVDAHREELGFSADAVQHVIPQAVLRAGITLPDGSGSYDSDEPSLGLMTTPIVAALVNAVKELTARITQLEGRA